MADTLIWAVRESDKVKLFVQLRPSFLNGSWTSSYGVAVTRPVEEFESEDIPEDEPVPFELVRIEDAR